MSPDLIPLLLNDKISECLHSFRLLPYSSPTWTSSVATMADSNMAAIRQLSEELKKAASILDDPGKFDIGSVTSYMSKQFVPGRGLLDLGAEDTVAAARASDDQDGNSDEGGSDDDYKQKEDDDSSDSDFFDEEDAYDDAVILEWLNSERTDASIVSSKALDSV